MTPVLFSGLVIADARKPNKTPPTPKDANINPVTNPFFYANHSQAHISGNVYNKPIPIGKPMAYHKIKALYVYT